MYMHAHFEINVRPFQVVYDTVEQDHVWCFHLCSASVYSIEINMFYVFMERRAEVCQDEWVYY